MPRAAKWSAASWRTLDERERAAALDECVAQLDAALAGPGEGLAPVYATLDFFVREELHDGLFFLSAAGKAANARWRAALERVHRARFGFWHSPPTSAQLAAVTPGLRDDLRARLIPLAADVNDFADGGTVRQRASELVKYAKQSGVVVKPNDALRLLAALEGGPVLP